jgi:hypothetical protein
MAPRWLRRSARKAGAPNAAGSSPAAPPDPRKTPPTAGSSPSVRIIASGSPGVRLCASPGAAAASSPVSASDYYDAVDAVTRALGERLAPPPLPDLAGDTMLAVASVPGKLPEEWREAWPLWYAHPHAAGAIYAVEMTAAQLRARLAAMEAG